MSARTWHSGPPPHVGWWNARVKMFPQECLWGWWNGERWSQFTDDQELAEVAANRAAVIGGDNGGTHHVEWSDYYPENARVPRVDPANPDQVMGKLLIVPPKHRLDQPLQVASVPVIVTTSLETASGHSLDAIGRMHGFFRNPVESNETFRARINAVIGWPSTPAPKAKRGWFARLLGWVKGGAV